MFESITGDNWNAQTGFIGKYVNVFNAFTIAKDGA